MKSSLLILTLFWSTLSWSSPNFQIIDSVQVQRHTLSTTEVEALPAHVLSSLQQVADLLAQIWGDTILEGDYSADDDVSLDSIEVLKLNEGVIGYRITYSSRAFDTAENIAGRILESAFVSGDFKAFSRDSNALAKFEAQP